MLNKLPYQLNQVILRVESALLKRFEGAHLLCDYVLLQGHQFKGQELANILREQLVLFKFTGVYVKQVNFFWVVARDKQV